MDDRSLNIDVVFRNGLKDYEVLPPSDVWENVKPAIRKKLRPYMIFRAAALIAVALSLGFLAYRWGQEVSSGQQELLQAQDNSAVVPSSSPDVTPLTAGQSRRQPVILADASIPAFKREASDITGPAAVIRDVENPAVSVTLTSEKTVKERNNELLTLSTPSANTDLTNLYIPYTMPETEEQASPGRWSLAALVSPSYHNRVSSGNNELMASMMTSEKPVISYSGGVALAYRVTKRFSVQSGLYFSDIGQELSGISAYSGFLPYGNAKSGTNFDVITANGTVKTRNPDIYLLDDYKGDRVITPYTSNILDPEKAELNYVGSSLRQDFRYLELPVMVRYKVIDRTLDLNIVGGVSSNLLVSNTVSTGIGSKYQVGETEGLNNITFSSSIGMGMEYNFSTKLSLNLEPTFRYYLNSFGTIPGLKVHPFSLGVFSGLSYKF